MKLKLILAQLVMLGTFITTSAELGLAKDHFSSLIEKGYHDPKSLERELEEIDRLINIMKELSSEDIHEQEMYCNLHIVNDLRGYSSEKFLMDKKYFDEQAKKEILQGFIECIGKKAFNEEQCLYAKINLDKLLEKFMVLTAMIHKYNQTRS